MIRPVWRLQQLANFGQLLARVVEPRTVGATADQIAVRLNMEGWWPPKRSAFKPDDSAPAAAAWVWHGLANLLGKGAACG
jgi:hypothetical protein